MASNIKISGQSMTVSSNELKGVASYFEINQLNIYDRQSTITANKNGRLAYYADQSIGRKFGNDLEQEAENIRSLGVDFEEYDEMLARLWDSEPTNHFLFPNG